MNTESSSTISDTTGLLIAWREGDSDALERLMASLYAELRRLAASHLRRERPDHTLQPTALVHEAFLRLIRQRDVDWRGRAHFFAVASTMMRRILVDHARGRRLAERRGQEPAWVVANVDLGDGRAPELVDLDAALRRLAAIDPQQERLVELRYFGGLTIQETAEVLGVTSRTVKRRWHTAKLWLYRYLKQGDPDGG